MGKSPRWLSSSSPMGFQADRLLSYAHDLRGPYRPAYPGLRNFSALGRGRTVQQRTGHLLTFVDSFDLWTGMRMVRAWSAMARVMAWRIHHVA